MKLFNLHFQTDHHLHRQNWAGSQCVLPSNQLQHLQKPAIREKGKHDTKVTKLIIFAFSRFFRKSRNAPVETLDVRRGSFWSLCSERVHVRETDKDSYDRTTPVRCAGFLPLAPRNKSQKANPEQQSLSVLKALQCVFSLFKVKKLNSGYSTSANRKEGFPAFCSAVRSLLTLQTTHFQASAVVFCQGTVEVVFYPVTSRWCFDLFPTLGLN